jgi:hypothetical protein
VFIILGTERLVKCCMTDGSILKDYTFMLFDAKRPTGIPADVWEKIGANSPRKTEISDIAATSDHKWLFAACNKGWWAMFDLEQDKCVSRQYFTLLHDDFNSSPTSFAVSLDDQLFYMVNQTGIVESYDILAAKTREVRSIPNQCFVKIAVDPNNKFLFISS